MKVENQDTGGTGEYKFVPADFTFKVGDTITFEMSGETEFHTFTVDELGIDEVVDGGETVTFDVTFDKPGQFKLICITHQAFRHDRHHHRHRVAAPHLARKGLHLSRSGSPSLAPSLREGCRACPEPVVPCEGACARARVAMCKGNTKR